MNKLVILIGRGQCSSSVTPVQKVYHQCKLHVVILDYDRLKGMRNFSEPMISSKMITKRLCTETLKKVFLIKKKWL